jgi:hypothetical protein
MQFLVTLTSDDVRQVAGPQRWTGAIELVAFGNRDSEGLAHVHISIFEGYVPVIGSSIVPLAFLRFQKFRNY